MTAPRKGPLEPDIEGLRRFVASDPCLEVIREAVGSTGAYLVGGSVRDVLLGRSPTDLDVAIEGEPSELARQIDPDATEHPRFKTARITIDRRQVDLAATRSERYAAPGSLPEVEVASLTEDLARRDFSINALAVSLVGGGEPIDPFDGLGALRERRLSLLKPDSLTEDPIRALRGARYAARFAFEPDAGLSAALGAVDLGTVSEDRLRAELERFGRESDPAAALEVARRWGLIDIPTGVVGLVGRSPELLRVEPWTGFVSLPEVVASALWSASEIEAVPAEPPSRRIEQYELLRSLPSGVIFLARVAGREWLDWWPREGRSASLEIDGDSLIEAGVRPGPAVGRGLRAALAEFLEEGGTDRARQLETAILAAEDEPVS